MMTWLVIALTASLLLWLATLVAYFRLREAATRSTAEVAAVAQSLGSEPVDSAELLSAETRHLLTIEILNPMEVAAQRSKIAGTLGSLSPGFIRGKVYESARDILQEKLPEFGLQAEVRVAQFKVKN